MKYITEQRLEEILDKKLDEKLDVLFMKFYKLLHGEIQETNTRLDRLEENVRGDIDRLYQLNDGVLKRLENHDHELAAMNNQLNRHNGWIKQIAGQSNVKLAAE